MVDAKTNANGRHIPPAKRIALVDLPPLLPRRPDGARVDFSTVWEWATTGPLSDRLPTTIYGTVRYTTLAAALEFLYRRQRKDKP